MTFEVRRYQPFHQQPWDDFVREAKNGVFLFERAYMDYHSDRFTDHSLLIYQDDTLVAVMPMSEHGEAGARELVSHGGLTYGGMITGKAIRSPSMLVALSAVADYARNAKFKSIRYKCIPYIYHVTPADEDLYALFRLNAALVRRDVSSTINLANPVSYSKGRKYSLSLARKAGLVVEESRDFETFMAIEAALLAEKYDTVPTHTASEMALLAERFPNNIRLFLAKQNDAVMAGVIMFESACVAHTQYIAATPEGKTNGAADCILDKLIKEIYAKKRYFDFGISTEQQGRYLNEGLISQKEMFSARATVYDTYEIVL